MATKGVEKEENIMRSIGEEKNKSTNNKRDSCLNKTEYDLS